MQTLFDPINLFMPMRLELKLPSLLLCQFMMLLSLVCYFLYFGYNKNACLNLQHELHPYHINTDLETKLKENQIPIEKVQWRC